MDQQMTLSDELAWRGFVNQTTYKDPAVLNGAPITFYWGVDPSADSMQVGNLAIAMMVRHFIDHGHKAVLLVGGATGLIGDPDGKSNERDLLTTEQIEHNKAAIAEQYKRLFAGQPFEIVDNYEWFRSIGYLDFLRDIGKHVPMRQMLSRDFIQSRLGESGAGISYAEFSYALIQGYDFLYLHREKGVNLQVCGADQWGNSVTGVDLIRRITGDETHIWSAPLVVNKTTGVKFGKSEGGAVWLDPAKTSPEEFYQFWINCDDAGVEDYLKIYTLLNKPQIENVMAEFKSNPAGRAAQRRLADEVTTLVHGQEAAQRARVQAESLQTVRHAEQTGKALVVSGEFTVKSGSSIVDALQANGVAASKSEARQLLQDGGIYINNVQTKDDEFKPEQFKDGILYLRRGKKLQNIYLVRLET